MSVVGSINKVGRLEQAAFCVGKHFVIPQRRIAGLEYVLDRWCVMGMARVEGWGCRATGSRMLREVLGQVEVWAAVESSSTNDKPHLGRDDDRDRWALDDGQASDR